MIAVLHRMLLRERHIPAPYPKDLAFISKFTYFLLQLQGLRFPVVIFRIPWRPGGAQTASYNQKQCKSNSSLPASKKAPAVAGAFLLDDRVRS
jgi:hypothetical protein